MTPKKVAIFRKRLLSYSETFIADQGQKLPGYQAFFCGYHPDHTGISLLANSERTILDEVSMLPAFDKFRLRSRLGGAQNWINKIKASAPQLIHAHFFNDGYDACRFAPRFNIPVITTLHGHDITKHQNATRQDFFSQVDRVIAVSDFIAEQALAKGCPEKKLVQHYIGIDLERFNQQKNETETPDLLFVGRLVEKKGCTYLLQALEKLTPRFPDINLTIVGEGHLRETLQQEAISRNLNVEFVGAQTAEQIRERLSRCWLFVAPSITANSGDAEGLGMVFLEAQALQTPVISFKSGGVVEAVKDGETGLLCNEKDVHTLSDNIAALLTDYTLRHSIGLNGRHRVESLFDVRKQCAKLETIYDEVI
ncbi:MAG: colanic acid/amylovoran biosynthesis glycosyltransferase [Gammaproteobacteria bacterium]